MQVQGPQQLGGRPQMSLGMGSSSQAPAAISSRTSSAFTAAPNIVSRVNQQQRSHNISSSVKFPEPITQRQPNLRQSQRVHMSYRSSNGLHGAMNMSMGNRGAGFSSRRVGGAPRSNGKTILNFKSNNAQSDEFTITHHPTAVSKPWGFSRQTTILNAEAAFNKNQGPTMVPDMAKRNLMNLILLGNVGATGLGLAGCFVDFFIPNVGGGGSGALKALDRNGDVIKKSAWLADHPEGSRALVQGLKGDAHYLISKKDGLEGYALNAVCTHLGCVVPWNKAENKFMCPCHGSQYDSTGKVIRGPAPLSLALAHIEIAEDDSVGLTQWTETDFRTGLQPWWK